MRTSLSSLSSFAASSRRHLIGAAVAALALGAAAPAAAQAAWPSKPVRFVVGFAAGGTTDIMARVIAQPLGQALGQPIVVDNKPGASSNIAVNETARAAADGYTFMVAPISMQTANPYLFKPALNPQRDLQPVISLGFSQLYLVTNKDLPVKTAADLVQLAKAQPGQLSYASGGAGTQMHLVGELFKQQAGIDTVHVPYRGAAPAMQDVLGGQVAYYFDPAIAFGVVREGRAKLLAVTGAKRSQFFPETPTLTELGIKGVELGNWFGVFAPAGVPQEIVERMSREIGKALALPETKRRYAELGTEPDGQNATAFRAIIDAETKLLSRLIKERNLTVE
ncbi:Bug family tripartite tricarboxylate transporter substrate binding protein [Hydrogenophaga palleronii]|uniref:Bug family tripartite tricarboxylate transporter substrate binding protein n=1 Tax=Hydrogenophaga palleronii TaxID=65655 RepID=UPI000824CDCD|nr:tripartite tricarboxylate transporter substrate binding protein [Hydrogenophaga palleronii]